VSYRRWLALALAVALAACAAKTADVASAVGGPIVVELYQSQGCSSCPPAEANLARIADRPDVIALNFAVTYWDQLGWKDTFAQSAFTQRQWDYAHAMGQGNVFTPEVVVDGRKGGVGIAAPEFAQLIGFGARTRLAGPAIGVDARRVTVAAGAPGPSPGDVWLIRYDPRVSLTPVGRGENAGKTLPQRDIVRQLIRLGAWRGAAESFSISPPADPAWRTAVLVQAANGGPILAAAKA